MRRLGRCGRARRKRSVKQGISQANLPVYVHLLTWMKRCSKEKCWTPLSKLLRPCDFEDTGRGLQATRHIVQGETLVSIPLSLLITPETVLASSVGWYIMRGKEALSPQRLLTIFLVAESIPDVSSPWCTYINTLPGVYSTPLYFSQPELDLLAPHVKGKAQLLIDRFAEAKCSMLKCVRNHLPWLAPSFTTDRLRWAWSTVDTRSVFLRTQPHDALHLDPEESNVALAPFLDLLNHSDKAKMTAGINQKTDCYEIITESNYRKREQVFICYGAYDNAKLMVNYGFVLPNNINNTYHFTTDDLLTCAEGVSRFWDRKVEILREADLLRNLVCSVEGVSWALQTAIKICLLPWKLLCRWKCLLQDLSLSTELEQDAQIAAVKMVSGALIKARKHLQLVRGQQGLVHHDLLLRLAQDDVDILEATLVSLGDNT